MLFRSGWPSSLDFSGFDTIIGGYFNSSYLFDGEISNVKIYNRVLSQEEITQNYNAGRLATLPSITNQTYTGKGGVYNNGDFWDFGGDLKKSYIGFGNIPTSTHIAVDCWVKLDVFHISQSKQIVGKWVAALPNSTNASWFIATTTSTQTFSFSISDGTVGYSASFSQSTISVNTWYNIVGIYDGDVKIYVNGVLGATSVTAPSLNSTSRDLIIGGRGVNGGIVTRFIDGKISNVKIYNRALTSQEVKDNYNALKGRFGIR